MRIITRPGEGSSRLENSPLLRAPYLFPFVKSRLPVDILSIPPRNILFHETVEPNVLTRLRGSLEEQDFLNLNSKRT